MLKKIWLAAAFAFAATTALAQNAVLQGGPTAAGRAPMYYNVGGGSVPVLQDSGSAGGGGVGSGLSELNITARQTQNVPTAPYANSGAGPFFTHSCMYDAPITNATGYHYLCMDPNAQGGGYLAYGAGGGATALPMSININGVTTTFPFAGMNGPPNTAAIFGSGGALQSGSILPAMISSGAVAYDLSHNSTTNNPSISFSYSGASFSASGTAGTTCGSNGGLITFPCLQGFNITGDTVGASAAGDLDGWQFSHTFGGSGVSGARQSVDVISTFTAPTSPSNPNRNYNALSTYMNIASGDGGTSGPTNAKGSWFGGNFVVRGTASYASGVIGQENDVNVGGNMLWRLGYTAVSWGGAQGSIEDAAYEIGAATATPSVPWVNGILLSNGHGNPPISTGGCIICTDGSADTILKGIDLHTYTITNNFLWSNGFSVDGNGHVTSSQYNMTNMVASSTAPTIASGFCTSPSILANGTAAFKITIGSACAAGIGTIALPTATNGWSCVLQDVTSVTSHVIAQAGYTTTSASFSDFSRTTGAGQNMTSGDTLLGQCSAF